jgi:hypothetical protein
MVAPPPKQRFASSPRSGWTPLLAATLDRLMADDFVLASGMGRFIVKPEWLDMALRRIVAKSFRYSDARVRVYGEEEFAVMQSWWSQQATIDGREWDGEGLMTDVWVKQEGRWRAEGNPQRYPHKPPGKREFRGLLMQSVMRSNLSVRRRFQ